MGRPLMVEHPAPHSSESVPSLKRPRETCSDIQGLTPYKYSLADIVKKRRRSTVFTLEDMGDYVFTGVEEVPEADLEDFKSWETLPKREPWSDLRKEDYDRVKRVFAGRGMRICKDTSDANMIEFKRSLLLAREDLF